MQLMDDTALSERESQVLCALIQAYIDSGMPIGSRLLLEREGWEFSAATVRNTLAAKLYAWQNGMKSCAKSTVENWIGSALPL